MLRVCGAVNKLLTLADRQWVCDCGMAHDRDHSAAVNIRDEGLRILAALAVEPRLDFVHLRTRTKLTDGNLCTHTRRLETAGLVSVEKSFRDRKPITHVRMTDEGRAALERHARELLAVLGMKSTAPNGLVTAEPARISSTPVDTEEEWVD